MPKRQTPPNSRSIGISTEELDNLQIARSSRRASLIQLKFGRAAHSLSAMASVMLASAAIIVFLLDDWEYLSENAPQWLEETKWLIPLVIGVIMSAVVLYLKWDPFTADRAERHFIASLIALIVPLVVITLLVMHLLDVFNVGTGTWIYPISFLGISVSLVSIAMIWEGMRRKKTIAIVSAIIPLAIMSAPMLFSDDTILGILPIVYLGSAVCILLSGSMMHLMSTATSLQEREILRAGDAKAVAIHEELEIKEEELEFRENALRGREVEIETFEKKLRDAQVELDHRIRHTERFEEELRNKGESIIEDKKKLESEKLELETREEKLEQIEVERESRERELKTQLVSLQRREKDYAEKMETLQREKAQAEQLDRRQRDRERKLEEEAESVGSLRRTVADEKKKLEDKTRELQLRESSLDMKIRSAERTPILSGDESDRINKLDQWEKELMDKEHKIASGEARLSERESEIEQTMKNAESKLSMAEDRMLSLDEKEKTLIERDSLVRNLEREISEAKSKLQERHLEHEEMRNDIDAKRGRYEMLIERLEKRNEEIVKREEIAERRMSALDAREEKVKALQERLREEIDEIEDRRREMIELDKKMSSKSSDLKMRELKIQDRKKRLDDMLHTGIMATETSNELLDDLREKERAIAIREKALAEKERELRRRAYEASREREPDMAAVEGGALESEARASISTGTKRLDDLLYGGLPFGSSVLFVGPPFSGKEIAMLSFLSEGLNEGLPVILITTSKAPDDLVKDFAPIFPSFLEMERMGLVRWIDATTGDDSKRSRGRTRKNLMRVEGPDDLPGILEAIEKHSSDVRDGTYPYLKLGYMSLSTSISHSDEMESTKFAQALARYMRELGSAGLFAIEKGMHSEQQIESLQHLMDGAIMIKTEKQKNQLSVIGIGEVQTRDWIEFRHSSKGLVIGAFSLERIR